MTRLRTVETGEAVHRALIASAPDGILLVDADGVIQFANPESAQIFGYPEQALVGRSVDSLVPAAARARHPHNRATFVQQPGKRPMGSGLDLAGLRADGSTVPVEISLSPVVSDRESYTLAIIRDVSERRRAEETIRELTLSLEARVRHLELLNAELESFSYSVSHDLRAPLRAIDGFSLALLEDCADQLDDDGRHYLNRVRAAAQRMAQLIDDLLALSRVSRSELTPEPVDISAIAEFVVRDLRRADPHREVEVHIEPGLSMMGDARLLRIVLENLIGNSWKFTSQQAVAAIRIVPGILAEVPAVTVSDNGPGFDEQYARKLFLPFQRLHSADEYPGTGIGLAIVERIVSRHGGRIVAESGPAGTSFTFTTGGTP